jgi:sulfite exporter TauE/SafE
MTHLFDSFVFGAANSVHCACMCGPLALAFGGGPAGTATYQLGRIGSYALVGCVLGATGSALGSASFGVPAATTAYVLAAALVVLALVGERGAMKIPLLSRWLGKATAKGRAWPPAMRAGLLGVLTPLLPCGLLWSACAGAAVSGSTLAGAEVMGGFALGSLPLLLLAQWNAPSLARRLSPTALLVVQRGAMLLAAATLVWRGMQAASGGCCS